MAARPIERNSAEGDLALFLVRELRRAEKMAAQVANMPRMASHYDGEASAYRMALAFVAGQHGHRTADTLIAELEAGDTERSAALAARLEPSVSSLAALGDAADLASDPDAGRPHIEPVGGWEPRT